MINPEKTIASSRILIALTAGLFSLFIGCAHSQKPMTPPGAKITASPTSATNSVELAENTSGNAAPDADEMVDTDQADGDEPDWLDNEFDEFDEAEPNDEMTPDPLSGFNRVMYHVNDFLYEGILSPVAGAYRALFPSKIRVGVNNFFTNLAGPLRFVNCLLQGKGEQADAEFVRFIMNSTVGVLGFGNPAGEFARLEPSNEDLGQTLGSYGIGDGFYIVWPILGPSTLRDTFGMLGDRFMHPVSYVTPTEASYGLNATERINSLSFRLGDYEALKEAAIDPYEAIRNAYLQYRKANIAK